MTDKELIKQEIEILYAEVSQRPYNGEVEGEMCAYDKLISFIDSLPEKPASEDLEEEINKYITGKNPVFENDPIPRNLFNDCIIAAAHHFAEWQKQQMMKDAVELHIIESFNPVGTENEKPHGFTALCYNAKYPDFYPVTGQTIKVVPIKEIQQNE